MSPLDKIIKQRTSIRKYKPDLPPEKWIKDMIQCAIRAPSPTNSQPVRFIRIKSFEVLNDLHQTMTKKYNDCIELWKKSGSPKRLKNLLKAYWRFSKFIFDAPLIFAVGTENYVSFSDQLIKAGLIQDTRGSTDVDISTGLALKGFILKAQELGLGTCILTGPFTFIPNPEKILDLKNIKIKCFLTVGFPDESPDPTPRKDFSEIYMEI
ncbi:Nitroreductase domain-containing protein [Candidatus Magnetomoraceae bacterium gMMP-15]